MAITRTIWKNKFTIENIPQWVCPSCLTGSLSVTKDSIKIIESKGSIAAHDHGDWDPEWIFGSFGGSLKCDNCDESILVIGKMSVESDVEYDEDTGTGNLIYTEFLFPTAFVPTVHLFTIHSQVPNLIKNAVAESFNVYWIDTASCGNKIRIVVELIMDDQKILKRYKIDNSVAIVPPISVMLCHSIR